MWQTAHEASYWGDGRFWKEMVGKHESCRHFREVVGAVPHPFPIIVHILVLWLLSLELLTLVLSWGDSAHSKLFLQSREGRGEVEDGVLFPTAPRAPA